MNLRIGLIRTGLAAVPTTKPLDETPPHSPALVAAVVILLYNISYEFYGPAGERSLATPCFAARSPLGSLAVYRTCS